MFSCRDIICRKPYGDTRWIIKSLTASLYNISRGDFKNSGNTWGKVDDLRKWTGEIKKDGAIF